jgi:sterol 3beta-glucosyltransferase
MSLALIPHAADQPFWGNRVATIGAGPKPIPVYKVTTENLADALIQASTAPIRQRAIEVGCLIRAENGVGLTGALSRNTPAVEML